MATEPKVDKQLEHQLEVVNELSRDPSAEHPGEVPSAPPTEHGETSGLKPLVDDLHDRRAKIKLGGGDEKIDAPAREGQADRARADRPARRPRHVRRDRHARAPALLAALDGGPRRARRRRDHRLGRGRRPPLRDRRLRLHRDGRLDGHDRRDQGRAHARDGAAEAHAVHLAARLRRRAHPGGGRLAVRRLRSPVPRGGDHVRRRPAGRRHARPVRGRHRLHPRARRLRPDGGRARARWRSPGRTS